MTYLFGVHRPEAESYQNRTSGALQYNCQSFYIAYTFQINSSLNKYTFQYLFQLQIYIFQIQWHLKTENKNSFYATNTDFWAEWQGGEVANLQGTQ